MIKMNYKIICNDKSIEFTNDFPALTFSEDIDKNFYRIDNDIVEVCYKDIKDINRNEDLKSKYKRIFILFNSVEKDEEEKIVNLLNYTNVIVVALNRQTNIIRNNNISILKGFKEQINIESLIKVFSNEEVLIKVRDRKNSSSIVIGNESLESTIEKMLKNLFQSFKYIENYKEYIMYIYTNKELGMQDIAYLEDLMKEYLYEANKIEIKQLKDSEVKNNIVYSILASK